MQNGKAPMFYCAPLPEKHNVGMRFICARVREHLTAKEQKDVLWIGAYGRSAEALYAELKNTFDQLGLVLSGAGAGKMNLMLGKDGHVRTADLFLTRSAYSDADLSAVEHILREQFDTLKEIYCLPTFRS